MRRTAVLTEHQPDRTRDAQREEPTAANGLNVARAEPYSREEVQPKRGPVCCHLMGPNHSLEKKSKSVSITHGTTLIKNPSFALLLHSSMMVKSCDFFKNVLLISKLNSEQIINSSSFGKKNLKVKKTKSQIRKKNKISNVILVIVIQFNFTVIQILIQFLL